MLKGIPESDETKFRSLCKKKKTQFKGFDTPIMELADDISYGVHDFEGALALKLVIARQWDDEVGKKATHNSMFKKKHEFFREKLFSEYSTERKHAISTLIAYFIPEIRIEEQDDFETLPLKFQ